MLQNKLILYYDTTKSWYMTSYFATLPWWGWVLWVFGLVTVMLLVLLFLIRKNREYKQIPPNMQKPYLAKLFGYRTVPITDDTYVGLSAGSMIADVLPRTEREALEYAKQQKVLGEKKLENDIGEVFTNIGLIGPIETALRLEASKECLKRNKIYEGTALKNEARAEEIFNACLRKDASDVSGRNYNKGYAAAYNQPFSNAKNSYLAKKVPVLYDQHQREQAARELEGHILRNRFVELEDIFSDTQEGYDNRSDELEDTFSDAEVGSDTNWNMQNQATVAVPRQHAPPLLPQPT